MRSAGLWDKLEEQEVLTPFPERNLPVTDGNMLIAFDLRRGSAAA